MKKRYRYAVAGGLLGAGGALLLAFPLLFLSELYLMSGGEKAAAKAGSAAVALFAAAAPALAGYAWGRRRELAAASEQPRQRAAGGHLTPLQFALGAIGAFAGAVLAYIAVAGALVLSAFALPRAALRRLDKAPDAALYALHIGGIALIVLSGWGGFRLAASLGRRSGRLPGD